MKRECGTCTKCCEGWLTGEAFGHKFYPSKPCHFIEIGKGCSIYSKRPKDPCITFECSWLVNEDIPMWMKPSEINTIIIQKKEKDIFFLSIVETGVKLDSKVLSWIIEYALDKQLNLCWQIDNGLHWFGSPEFNLLMSEKNFPNSK